MLDTFGKWNCCSYGKLIEFFYETLTQVLTLSATRFQQPINPYLRMELPALEMSFY